MKYFLQLVTGLLLASVLFSACNSSLSITKRRYNRGFYVHKATSNHVNSDRANLRHIAKTAPATAVEQPNDLLAHAGNTQPNVAESPQAANKPNNTNKILHPASATAQVTEFITHPVRSIQSISEKIKMETDESDALSLVWVIVVILLAAYIAGLLLDNFGLGWVIHLLLVAALVLLILWLLKIV